MKRISGDLFYRKGNVASSRPGLSLQTGCCLSHAPRAWAPSWFLAGEGLSRCALAPRCRAQDASLGGLGQGEGGTVR